MTTIPKHMVALNEEAKRLAKKLKSSRLQLGKLLIEMDEKKGYWEKGCSSLYKYCETFHKLDPDEVDEILDETYEAIDNGLI